MMEQRDGQAEGVDLQAIIRRDQQRLLAIDVMRRIAAGASVPEYEPIFSGIDGLMTDGVEVTDPRFLKSFRLITEAFGNDMHNVLDTWRRARQAGLGQVGEVVVEVGPDY